MLFWKFSHYRIFADWKKKHYTEVFFNKITLPGFENDRITRSYCQKKNKANEESAWESRGPASKKQPLYTASSIISPRPLSHPTYYATNSPIAVHIRFHFSLSLSLSLRKFGAIDLAVGQRHARNAKNLLSPAVRFSIQASVYCLLRLGNARMYTYSLSVYIYLCWNAVWFLCLLKAFYTLVTDAR